MKIAVVGSGYVGLVAGACLADNGNDVVCVDKDASKIESLKRGEIPIAEPGLDSLTTGLEASGRWVLDNQALAQLLFWRPVPNFEPSPVAFAPSKEIAGIQQQAIADAVSVPVVASGGVGTLDHLVEGVTQGHASAVLAASIFHYGEHTIDEAKLKEYEDLDNPFVVDYRWYTYNPQVTNQPVTTGADKG